MDRIPGPANFLHKGAIAEKEKFTAVVSSIGMSRDLARQLRDSCALVATGTDDM